LSGDNALGRLVARRSALLGRRTTNTRHLEGIEKNLNGTPVKTIGREGSKRGRGVRRRGEMRFQALS